MIGFSLGDWSPRSDAGGGDISGYLGAGSSILGGIAGLFGGIRSGEGAYDAGMASAKAYEANALAAGETAANTWLSIERQNQQANYQENRLIGQQRVGYAAGGVSPFAGSALSVLGDTEAQYKFAAMSRFYKGLETQRVASEQYNADIAAAAAARKAAESARGGGILGAFSGLLGGIGSAAPLIGKIFAL